MKTLWKFAIVAALVAAVAGTLTLKAQEEQDQTQSVAEARADLNNTAPATEPAETETLEVSKALPRLIDLGADKCIPCKMMAPILDGLKTEYAGKFDVEFIDVWRNESAGAEYNIRVIPTQIFFDAEGKELFRHEGFFSREDILDTWKNLDITFGEEGEVSNTTPG